MESAVSDEESDCGSVQRNGSCWGIKVGQAFLVFQKDGLKGEIKTTSPIQKLVVSEQGIVGVVLKGESTQQIICYDAKGNILVEQNTSLAKYWISVGYLPFSNNWRSTSCFHTYLQKAAKR